MSSVCFKSIALQMFSVHRSKCSSNLYFLNFWNCITVPNGCVCGKNGKRAITFPCDSFLDSQKIDWDLVNLCLNSYIASVGDCRLPVRWRPAPPLQLPIEAVPLTQLLSQTASPRTVFHFVPDDFINAVLTPTYRNVEYPPRYYVVAIRYAFLIFCLRFCFHLCSI